MEVSEYLVGSPAFKAGDTGDPRMAGSIPVHLRQIVFAPLLLAIAVAAVLTVGVAPANGAALLLTSTPADGESLPTLEEISFDFDTLLVADGASMSIVKLDGTAFEVSDVSIDRTTLRGIAPPDLPSGNYEIGYSVRASDGSLNTDSIRVSIDAPAQSLSGGLIAVVAIAGAMMLYMGVVFRADKTRRRRRPS